jgi:hypothetical protein
MLDANIVRCNFQCQFGSTCQPARQAARVEGYTAVTERAFSTGLLH